jgi:hypothetical protein
MKRYLVGLVAVGAVFGALLMVGTPASAAPPAGGCPPGFSLVSVGTLPGSISGAPSTDVNKDGLTCDKPIVTGTGRTGGVVVDNASHVR